MLLLTMREWFGPSESATERNEKSGAAVIGSDVRLRAFVTKLPLGRALMEIRAYEDAFKARYSQVSGIAFELVHVAYIDDLNDSEITAARVSYVERLKDLLISAGR